MTYASDGRLEIYLYAKSFGKCMLIFDTMSQLNYKNNPIRQKKIFFLNKFWSWITGQESIKSIFEL